MGLMILFRHPIIALYNTTPEVVEVGGSILLFVALLQPVQAHQFITSGGLRGVGDTRYGAVITFITTLGMRALLTVITVYGFHWGLWGVWIAICSDQIVRTLLMAMRYRSGKWKEQLRRRHAGERVAA